jgi:putative SOS response-associated peptidase YedK
MSISRMAVGRRSGLRSIRLGRSRFFAGIWTRWTSVRKVKEGETTNDLFAFLTIEPNKVVGAIHPKAMPVIRSIGWSKRLVAIGGLRCFANSAAT